MTIPGGGTPPPGPPPTGYGPGQPPGSGGLPPGALPSWSAADAVSYAFSWVTSDFAAVALPLAVGALCMALPSLLTRALQGALQGLLGEGAATIVMVLFAPLQFAVGVCTQAFLLGGVTRFALTIARGRRPDFQMIFSGGDTFPQLLLAQAVFTLGVTVGSVMCLLPGLILWSLCQLYPMLVVDRGLRGIDALKESYRLTQSHLPLLLGLALFQFGIGLLGLAACCVGAFLFAAPVWALSSTYAYLKLTGEQPVQTQSISG